MAASQAKYQNLKAEFEALMTGLFPKVEAASKNLDDNSVLELEVKFKGLVPTEFFRIRTLMANREDFGPMVLTSSSDYSIDNARYSKGLTPDGSVVKTIKTSLFTAKELDNWNLRVTCHSETNSRVESLPGGVVKSLRQKERSSWENLAGSFRVDITRVKSSNPQNPNLRPTIVYECEVEFIKISTASIKAVAEILCEMMDVKQDSKLAYTEKRKRGIIADLNSMLTGYPGDGKLQHTFMPNARNLKHADIVTGGLIGGDVGYTGTIKADGERKFLLFYDNEVWLVYPPGDFNLICKISSEKFKAYHGTMIDGEDIPMDKRKPSCPIKTKHMFIPFDMCLKAVKDGISSEIQKFSHLARLGAAESILRKPMFGGLRQKGLSFSYKNFHLLGKDFNSLKSVMIQLEQEAAEAEYLTDGYMFTPNETFYDTGTENVRLSERVLTSHADICKLKPWENQTIDLLIERDQNDRLKLMTNSDGKLVEFEGSHFYPLNAETQIDWDSKLLTAPSTGSIIEFQPFRLDSGAPALEPKQIRGNKVLPNKLEYACSIWDDINNPIEMATLEGKTFRLLRNSFNRIKAELYKLIPDKADVFEIGTGNGGQFTRWRRFHKILGVEPSQEHINEMMSRISAYDAKAKKPMGGKIQVLNLGAEQTEEIVKAAAGFFKWKKKKTPRPFYIVSMLSLSFFWGESRMLQGLISTLRGLTAEYRRLSENSSLKVGFIFMTIEGSRVQQLFDSYPDQVLRDDTKNITLGPCKMAYSVRSGVPTIEINIDDSIVEQQTEYLVKLDDLVTGVPLSNLELGPVDTEFCMSDAERTYAQLFVTGVSKIGDIFDSPPLLQMSTLRRASNSPRGRRSQSPTRKRGTSPPSPPEEKHRDEDDIDVNLIRFKYSGQAEFTLRSTWTDVRFHEEQGKTLKNSSEAETSCYVQRFFGTDNLSREWKYLGSLGEKVVPRSDYTITSLIHCILSSTSKEYQEEPDDKTRAVMCQDFQKSIVKALVNGESSAIITSAQKGEETPLISQAAAMINPMVKAWLPLAELERYNLRRLSPGMKYGKFSLDAKEEARRQERGRREVPFTNEKYFYGFRTTTIARYIEDEDENMFIIDDSIDSVNLISNPPERSKSGALNDVLKVMRQYSREETFDIKSKEDLYDFLERNDVALLIRDEDTKTALDDSYPYELKITTNIYRVVGEIGGPEYDSAEQYLNSIDDATYLDAILSYNEISDRSVLYNCRGGAIFRYLLSMEINLKDKTKSKSKSKSKTASKGKGDFYLSDGTIIPFGKPSFLFLCSIIPDLTGLSIKTLAMPEGPEDGLPVLELPKSKDAGDIAQAKNIHTALSITQRNFAKYTAKYSFYPTTVEYGLAEAVKFKSEWEKLGPKQALVWSNDIKKKLSINENSDNNISEKVIYTYYHHFEPECKQLSGDHIWKDKDVHQNGDQLGGIYVPLGLTLEDGTIKTLFSR